MRTTTEHPLSHSPISCGSEVSSLPDTLPVYGWWDELPCRLMTKTGLKRIGFVPGPVVAQIRYGRGKRFRCYDLYDLAAATPRVLSLAQWAGIEKAARSRRTCKRCQTVLDDAKHRYGGVCWTCVIDAGECVRGGSLAQADGWMRTFLRAYHAGQVPAAPSSVVAAMTERVGRPRARIFTIGTVAGRAYSGTWVCPHCTIDNFPTVPLCLRCGSTCTIPRPALPRTDEQFAAGATPVVDTIRGIIRHLGTVVALTITNDDERATLADRVAQGQLGVQWIRVSPWVASRIADELAALGDTRPVQEWEQVFGCGIFVSFLRHDHGADMTVRGPAVGDGGRIIWRFD